MDPKTMMELSRLVQDLPPEKLNRMQSLMHNMMAGFDVKKDLEEFERSLPAGFREKIVTLMGGMGAGMAAGISEPEPVEMPGDIRTARLTILRGVAQGHMTPEQAEKLLFPD